MSDILQEINYFSKLEHLKINNGDSILITNEIIEKGVVDDINGDLYFGFD